MVVNDEAKQDEKTSYDTIVSGFLQRRPLDLLIEEAMDFAQCSGLGFRLPEHKSSSDVVQVAPMALFPSPFPKDKFEQANSVQQAMMELYHRIAWDHEFLTHAHKNVRKTDDFVRRLMRLYDDLWNKGITQKKTLLLQRSDYMLDVSEGAAGELRQVEVNNIAAGAGGLAERTSMWHRKLLKKLKVPNVEEHVPGNAPMKVLASGIVKAWQSMQDPDATILFVVEDVNQNQMDQRLLEYAIDDISDDAIDIVRLTLTESANRLSLSATNQLLLDGVRRISLVYFRAGYSPTHYPSEREWNARRVIEYSDAIKCPWIGLQLANTKKVQQVLALPGNVERFFPESAEKAAKIRATFAGLWGFDEMDRATEAVIADAIAFPHKYVLKAQREGGGGNFYDQQLVEKLVTLSPEKLSAYILMQRMRPLPVQNVMVFAFRERQLERVTGELGIFGCVFGNGPYNLLHSESNAHILRSKAADSPEGGFAMMTAVIDSPYLC